MYIALHRYYYYVVVLRTPAAQLTADMNLAFTSSDQRRGFRVNSGKCRLSKSPERVAQFPLSSHTFISPGHLLGPGYAPASSGATLQHNF